MHQLQDQPKNRSFESATLQRSQHSSHQSRNNEIELQSIDMIKIDDSFTKPKTVTPGNVDTNSFHFVTKNITKTDRYSVLQKESIFDSLGCQFHLSVFLKQWIAHLFIPFLLFIPNYYAQGLRARQAYYVWCSIIHPLLVYGMLIAFACCSPNDQELLGYTALIPLLFFIVHRTMVALKYATLSPTEYNRLMQCTDKTVLDSYMSQLQLLTGWGPLDDNVLYFELCAASSRIGVKINSLTLRIPKSVDEGRKEDRIKAASICSESVQNNGNKNSTIPIAYQFEYWNAFMRGNERVDVDTPPAREFVLLSNGDYGITVFDLCLSIIRGANQVDNWKGWCNMCVKVVITLLTAILVFPLVLNFNAYDNIWIVMVYIIQAIIILYAYASVCFSFLYIAVLDVSRYKGMMETLHSLIRLTDIMMHNHITVGNQIVTDQNAELARDRQDTILSIAKVLKARHIAETKVQYPEAKEKSDGFYDRDGEDSELPESIFRQRIDSLSDNTASIGSVREGSGSSLWIDSIATTTPLHQQRSDNLFVGGSELFTDPNEDTRFGETIPEHLSLAIIPRLDFSYPENVTAWLYARLAIQNFGVRFRYRSDIYVGKYFPNTLMWSCLI